MSKSAIVILFCLFIFSTSQADQMTSINTLLKSFGGSCSIQGSQSRQLEAAAQSLSNALSAMQASPECAGLGTIASGVHGAVDRMAYLAPQYTSEEIEYQSLKEKRSALVSALAVESDPVQIASLQVQLRTTEIQLAEAKQTWALEKINDRNANLISAAQSYRSATDALLKGLVDNTQCLDRHPRVAQEFGQIGLALAQSSTLGVATSGASILAGAGIYTAARLAEFINDRQNSLALRKFSDPLLASSLSCAMEALNEIYCESEKNEKLGSFILSPEMDIIRKEASSPFAGLELLEKATPSLDTSLTLIKIGSDPSSGNDAMARMGINALKVQLQSTKGTLFGLLNDLRKAINAIDPSLTDPLLRQKQILKAQKDFVHNFMNYTSVPEDGASENGKRPGVLASIYSGQKAKWYLMGFDPTKINVSEPGYMWFGSLEVPALYNGNPKNPWELYKKSDGSTHFQEDFGIFQAEVQARFDRWYNEAQSSLDAQANLILKTDKKEIIASLERPIARDYKLTPLLAMQRLVQYITNTENQRFLTPKYRKIADEVATVIENDVVAKLNSLSFEMSEKEFEEKANEVFKHVLKSTRYDDDTRFLINRITVLVNIIVTEASIELYKNGSPEMIYALASNDVVKELKSFAASSKSTVDMVHDSKKTKGQIPGLLAAFVTGFSHPLKRTLEELNTPQNRVRRAVERGHLCLQLLGFDGSFDRKFLEKTIVPNCEGAELPVLPRMPASPKVTRELFNKPLEERICTHQNWRRKLLIHEKGGN